MRRRSIAAGAAGVTAMAAVALLAPGTTAAEELSAGCAAGVGDVAALRQAITDANAQAGADSIVLGAGCTYTVPDVDNSWYGPNGLPEIASSITVEGRGATIARQAGAPKFRFFFVGADPAATPTVNYVSPGPGRLTLRDLTLSGGLQIGGSTNFGGGGAGMGGAVFSQGSLILERVTLTENAATGGSTGCCSGATGGGGMGSDATGQTGGGFGDTGFGGSTGSASGGGAGFRTDESATGPDGGGVDTGLGAASGGIGAGQGGDGSGGGTGGVGSAGGDFGQGGTGGGGGGVGGGGGFILGFNGFGGGGFGGGGGDASRGGFGGGGGGGGNPTPGGFGGGVGSPSGAGGGGAGMGGAIFNHAGTLTATNATFVANQTRGGQSQGGDASNIGDGLGGAIFNLNGTVTVTNSTFAANVAPEGGGAVYSLGYGKDATRAVAAPAALTLVNSILADSSDGASPPTPVSDLVNGRPATLADGSANQAVATTTATAPDIVEAHVGTVSGAPSTADPQLGSLAFSGGPGMLTLLPPAASPAIDAGQAAGCPATDERGALRLVGGPCDLGAVERTAPAADTGAASGIQTTAAVIAGVGSNPGLDVASARFQYGPTAAYGSDTPLQELPPATTARPLSAVLSGLEPNTTYHYRLLVTAPDGNAAGGDRTFTTGTATTTSSRRPRCRGRAATIVARAGLPTRGTRGRDVIVGTARRDVIDGRGGADLICARGGRDDVKGGAGRDRIYGQGGNDRLAGGTGNDRVHGGPGNDRLDRRREGRGRDKLIGGSGRDRIFTADGRRDIVRCGPGKDRVTADRLDRLSGCERTD